MYGKRIEGMAEIGIACKTLHGGLKGRRAVGSRGRVWKNNIKWDLREIGFWNIDWINLA